MKKTITKKKLIFRIIIGLALLPVVVFLVLYISIPLPEGIMKGLTLSYLKNKYKQDFIVTSYEPAGWAYNINKVYMHPKGKEKEPFQVWVELKLYGFISHDNYFQYIIRDEYEKAIGDMFKEYFIDFKVFMPYQSGVFPNGLNHGTKLEDIYSYTTEQNNSLIGDFRVFVKESELNGKDIKDILYKIAQKRGEKKLVGRISLCNAFDDKFNLISRENWPNHSQYNRDLGVEKSDDMWYYLLASIDVGINLKMNYYDYK